MLRIYAIEMSTKELLIPVERYSIFLETSKTPSPQLKMDEKQSLMSFSAKFPSGEARFPPLEAKFSPCTARFSLLEAIFSPCEAKFSLLEARFSP